MKKIKTIKKLLVGIVVSLFAITGVNAEAIQIGNMNIDLAESMNNISGADDTFLENLTQNAYTFTNGSSVSININNGFIYGTKDKPIQAEYTNRNLIAQNVSIINIAYNTQQTISLDGYNFVNRIPDSINIPVPMFIEESLTKPDEWSYTPPTPEGATNSKVTISGLREKMTNAENMIGGYTYDSGIWKYLIRINSTALGMEGTSQNEISWNFNAPFSVKYTVDIAPITEGGTPSVSGLTCGVTSLASNVEGNNSDYFKNGEINTTVDGGDTMAIGDIADLAEDKNDNTVTHDGMRECGDYDSDYTASYDPEDGYFVDYININVYDPYTGELKESKEHLSVAEADEIIANGLDGKTEIRVAYIKDLPMLIPEEDDTMPYVPTVEPVEEEPVENPLTADTIIVISTCFTIAVVALFITSKVKKYNK